MQEVVGRRSDQGDDGSGRAAGGRHVRRTSLCALSWHLPVDGYIAVEGLGWDGGQRHTDANGWLSSGWLSRLVLASAVRQRTTKMS